MLRRRSIAVAERIGNDRLGAVLPQQIIDRLDTKRLQRPILVEGELAERSEALRIHPDQKAAHVTLHLPPIGPLVTVARPLIGVSLRA
jgi:hypothetical protein